MASSTEALTPLPSEITGWSCRWSRTPNSVEVELRRHDRRNAGIGEILAGRVIVARQERAWLVEARLWVLEDLAEHQRLRVRRATIGKVDELPDLLADFGLPPEIAQQVAEAARRSDASA